MTIYEYVYVTLFEYACLNMRVFLHMFQHIVYYYICDCVCVFLKYTLYIRVFDYMIFMDMTTSLRIPGNRK